MATVPAQTHDGNLNRTKIIAQPDAGARAVSGKTSNPDSAMTDAYKATPEAVRDAKCDEGATLKCVARQVEGPDGVPNSSPKARTTNSWGRDDGTRK